MENNKKPEWFELADNDQPASRPIKNAPKRSLAFILAGVLVLPMGAGFALLSHDDNSAVAAETINLTQDSPAAVSSSAAKPSSTITMPTATHEEEGENEGDDGYRAPTFSNTASSSPTASSSTSEAPVAKASVAITPPGTSSASNELILPPTKKAGDDDDDDDNYKKKSDGKKSKKSEHDDEDGEDEEDDD